jgi:hypothetical protein
MAATAHHASITIRPAYADDELTLRRLAALDSAPAAPRGPLLLAEVDGVVTAALSLSDGSSIADPFTRTTDILELLRQAAAPGHVRPRRRGLALRPAARFA